MHKQIQRRRAKTVYRKSTYLTWSINRPFARKLLLKRPWQTGQRTSGQLGGGPGERCNLPQRGPGMEPGRKRISMRLQLSKHPVHQIFNISGGGGQTNNSPPAKSPSLVFFLSLTFLGSIVYSCFHLLVEYRRP